MTAPSNLGLYVADPLTIAVTNGGSGYTAPPTVGLVSGGDWIRGCRRRRSHGGAVTGILRHRCRLWLYHCSERHHHRRRAPALQQ